MGKRKPIVLQKSTVNSLVQDGHSTLESLGGELREWFDNLPEQFQGNRSDIDEAASTLENLSCPDDAPECVADLEVEYNPKVEKGTSRRAQGQQATYEIGVAIERVDAWLDENEKHQFHDDVESWLSEVREMMDEADGVDYPGMYA